MKEVKDLYRIIKYLIYIGIIVTFKICGVKYINKKAEEYANKLIVEIKK